MTVIGLLHPGEMGAAIGRCLRQARHHVLWASAGRGAATEARAAEAGLTDVETIAALSSQAAVMISVCPPHAALDLARQVAGYRGHYVDANAVSPATAAQIGAVIEAGGGTFTDGGIIGPPPDAPGLTRLYLSGDHAPDIAALFAGSAAEPRIVPGASAVKMAYAAWTKGTAALLLAITALARSEGIEDALLAEWRDPHPVHVSEAERNSLRHPFAAASIELGLLGPEATVLGAATLPMEEFLNDAARAAQPRT